MSYVLKVRTKKKYSKRKNLPTGILLQPNGTGSPIPIEVTNTGRNMVIIKLEKRNTI